MTFDPKFLMYRDGWPGSCETLADMKAEAEAELATRERRYPRMVAKGRLSPGDSARELRVMRAIVADLHHGPDGNATWTERVHCLRREIALRRQIWPGLIEAGRIDRMEADRRLRTIESLHYMTWHFDWSAEAVAGRAETERRAAA